MSDELLHSPPELRVEEDPYPGVSVEVHFTEPPRVSTVFLYSKKHNYMYTDKRKCPYPPPHD
jgi:hypothetical protein